MVIVRRLVLAFALATLGAVLLGGCGSDAAPPVTAAGVAAPCNPARCGQRPLAPRRRCADGSFAGVGACVQTGGARCGWQVIDCPSGG